MIIDAGHGRQGKREVPSRSTASSAARGISISPSPRPASRPTTSTSCSLRISTSIMRAASPSATPAERSVRAFPARSTSSGAASGRTPPIRTRERAPATCWITMCRWLRRASCSSSMTIRRSCRACECGGPEATPRTIRWCSSSRRKNRRVRRRPDPDTAHLPEVWVMGYDLFPLESMAAKQRFVRGGDREGHPGVLRARSRRWRRVT